MPEVRRGKVGFSLLEVLVVSTILLLLGGGFLSLGWRKAESRTLGAAELIEEELRAARQSALRQKTYVAVAFPSANGGRPHAAGYYRLEGVLRPRITRSRDLSREYPGLSIFVGFWGLNTALLDDPAAVNTAATAVSQQDWDFASWQAPFPQDHHLVFGPDGKVYSNGLPRFDQSYHLLVNEAIEFQSSSLSGIRSYSPTRVLAPNTIRVSLAGYIGTSRGVLAQDNSVQVTSSRFSSPVAPALPPGLSGGGTANPVLRSVRILPIPEPQTLAPGVDATVDLDGYLTLHVEAEDRDGDRLFCNWSVRKVSGSGSAAGVFSAPQQSPMEWQGSLWNSIWEWRPPLDALPGDIFQLDCRVTDETGRFVDGRLGAAGRVEVIGAGQIVYERGGDVWIVNADGTGERNLTNHPALDFQPCLSPEGMRVAFISNRSGADEFWVMGLDGRNLRRIPLSGLGGAKAPRGLVWSPRGNELAAGLNENEPTSADYAKEALFVLSADGSGGRQIGPWADNTHVAWHPNGNRFLVSGDSSKTIRELDLSGNLVELIPAGTAWSFRPLFSRDGNRVLFSQGPLTTPTYYPSGDFDIMLADYTPGSLSNIRKVIDSGFTDRDVDWSPFGNQMVFASDRSGRSELYIANLDGSNLRQITTGGGSRPRWGRR